jgi:RNA polymerase sigma-70 factor (ECF subfamily)
MTTDLDRNSMVTGVGTGERLSGGDVRGQIDALYRRHWNEICRSIARSFGTGSPDPEDAAQAAFSRYAEIENKDAIKNPRAYLFRTAHTYVIDFRRRQSTQARYLVEATELFATPSASNDQYRVLVGKQRLAALTAAVRTLEPRRRKVLIWHTIHELSFAEIARQMGLSQVRVRQLFADALLVCATATNNFD